MLEEEKIVVEPATEVAGEQNEQAEAEPDGDAPESEQSESKKDALDWRERRRIQEVNKRRDAERKLQEAQAEIDRLKRASGATEQPERVEPGSIEDIRRQERERIRQELQAQEFNAACNRTFDQGSQKYQDFVVARDSLVEHFGDELQAHPAFLEAITDLPNGHDVFYHLGKNPEEAERVLSMSPVKMAMEIAKLGDKIAKPAAKQISQAPRPVKPSPGTVETGTRLDDTNTPMEDWAKTFLKTVVKR